VINQYSNWNEMYKEHGKDNYESRSITENGFDFITGKENGIVSTQQLIYAVTKPTRLSDLNLFNVNTVSLDKK
jgi:hypothetical protein